jgi:hypothetical protein
VPAIVGYGVFVALSAVTALVLQSLPASRSDEEEATDSVLEAEAESRP